MTGKQEAFVEAYINDIYRNQTAAAIEAGYSPKTAAAAASRLMKDAEVRAAIKERLKELHEQNTAKTDEIMEFLTSVMRGEKIDNIPLFVGDGEQKLTEGSPSARDKLKAAELLGKHYALFADKVLTEGNGVVIIKDDIPRSDKNAEAD